ncbi:MAG: hypothetical protein ABIH59_01235 [archaeon]
MINKKGFLQMSFGWLFALILGAFILFLAIFFSVKLINTEEASHDAQLAKDIGILLNPLETGFETMKVTYLDPGAETRIYNRCENKGNFGMQTLRTSQKSFGKWSETYVEVGFPNKYLFSEDFLEARTFYLFSKPFDFPFKVADLIYIIPQDKKYCFINAPERITTELKDTPMTNIFTNNCPEDIDMNICFSGNCDVRVNLGAGYVQKDSEKMYFKGDTLMYAAIFSDFETYECQLKRLMQRTQELSLLYNKKAVFVAQKNCNTNLNLLGLNGLASNFDESRDIQGSIYTIVESINKSNNLANCKLW